MTRALIVVDVQNDFVSGSLAVAGATKVAEAIGEYIQAWEDMYEVVIFTADWHNPPPDNNGGHFSDNPDYVDSWPVHCVAGTEGGNFNKYITDAIMDLGEKGKFDPARNIFFKGQGTPDYSGFQGTNMVGNYLNEYLIDKEVKDIDVVGIAGDHCVLATALDAKSNDYVVNILPGHVASVGGVDATMAAVKTLAGA